MRVLDVEQNTQAWVQARLGVFTASSCNQLLAVRKDGKPSTGRANLIARLALERLTGHALESYQSRAMARGHEIEGPARTAYEAKKNIFVEEVGFCLHDFHDHIGCSPDGLVGNGIVQIKAPDALNVHAQYLLNNGKLSNAYKRQVIFEMYVTDAEWADLVSFDPRYPEDIQILIERVPRNDDDMAMLSV